jgi:hypothetical protein
MDAPDSRVITDNPAASRYELRVDDSLAGFVQYRLGDDGKVITLVHTEVLDAFQGKGLAGVLAKGTLDDVRKRGLAAVVECEYLRSWIGKHPDYADLGRQ